MEKDKKFIQISEFFKALSDPTRLKIVSLLSSSNQLCVNIIADKIGMTQPAISQHLKVLRQAGIINAQKVGLYVHYSINDELITEYNNNFITLLKGRKKQDCIQCPEKMKV